MNEGLSSSFILAYIPPRAAGKKGTETSNVRICEASFVTDNGVFKAAAYLVDGKANGFHVLPQFPHFPPVLLHQAHNEGAALLLTIVRVIIHIIQLYDKLRVHPEGV